MEYRFLGRSGLKVSALSYGAWVTFSDQMDEDAAAACMQAAYDAGVNFFDNAEVYAAGRAETAFHDVPLAVFPAPRHLLAGKSVRTRVRLE